MGSLITTPGSFPRTTMRFCWADAFWPKANPVMGTAGGPADSARVPPISPLVCQTVLPAEPYELTSCYCLRLVSGWCFRRWCLPSVSPYWAQYSSWRLTTLVINLIVWYHPNASLPSLELNRGASSCKGGVCFTFGPSHTNVKQGFVSWHGSCRKRPARDVARAGGQVGCVPLLLTFINRNVGRSSPVGNL